MSNEKGKRKVLSDLIESQNSFFGANFLIDSVIKLK